MSVACRMGRSENRALTWDEAPVLAVERPVGLGTTPVLPEFASGLPETPPAAPVRSPRQSVGALAVLGVAPAAAEKPHDVADNASGLATVLIVVPGIAHAPAATAPVPPKMTTTLPDLLPARSEGPGIRLDSTDIATATARIGESAGSDALTVRSSASRSASPYLYSHS